MERSKSVMEKSWNSVFKFLWEPCSASSGGVVSKAYGPGTGTIWMDDVECLGDEHHLGQCQLGFWGRSNCDHNEDVSCVCAPLSSGDSEFLKPRPQNYRCCLQ